MAAEFGVGGATVMGAVCEYGTPLVEDPSRLDGVHTLGVDETAFLAATPTSGTTFATGVVAQYPGDRAPCSMRRLQLP